MPTDKTHVMDVNEANFEYAVISGSQSRPVVVDFWADWCQPCKVLGPLLERLADEFQGAFLLAKVNVEQAPQLAATFGAQSIPMVLLVKQGRVVDQFVGALPEREVRKFLKAHIEAPAEKVAKSGWELERAGDLSAAEAAYRDALKKDANDGEANLGLGRILLSRLEIDKAEEQLKKVDEVSSSARQANWHVQALEFWRDAARAAQAPPQPAAAEDLNANANANAQLAQAAALVASRDYEKALAALLQALERDRSYRDGLARKAMLSLFGVLGADNDITKTYQTRMASMLY